MNAQVVYQVAKALQREEQKALFEMLQKEFGINTLQIKKNEEACANQRRCNSIFTKECF